MSRRALIILAFVCALLLMAGAGRHIMFYKSVPPERFALWFPFIVLLRLPEDTAPLFWLLQFPALAGIFIVAGLRWSPRRVLVLMVVLYALCSAGAFLMIRAHRWPNHALQRTEAGDGVVSVL